MSGVVTGDVVTAVLVVSGMISVVVNTVSDDVCAVDTGMVVKGASVLTGFDESVVGFDVLDEIPQIVVFGIKEVLESPFVTSVVPVGIVLHAAKSIINSVMNIKRSFDFIILWVPFMIDFIIVYHKVLHKSIVCHKNTVLFVIEDEYIYRKMKSEKREMVLSLLPFEITNALRLVSEQITEIRIRRNRLLAITVLCDFCGDLVFENREISLRIDDSMMERTVAALTRGSLYSYENTIKKGYIIVQGCRIGISGSAIYDRDEMITMAKIDSLCIRLPHECIGISAPIVDHIKENNYNVSVLIFSPPSKGKTTVLFDLASTLSEKKRVVLIDSRDEFSRGSLYSSKHLDVLSGYPKAVGMDIATRLLFPEYILCDEIGKEDIVEALSDVQNRGVPVIMTAHAGSIYELMSRTIFQRMHRDKVFDTYVSIDSLKDNDSANFSFINREEVSV